MNFDFLNCMLAGMYFSYNKGRHHVALRFRFEVMRLYLFLPAYLHTYVVLSRWSGWNTLPFEWRGITVCVLSFALLYAITSPVLYSKEEIERLMSEMTDEELKRWDRYWEYSLLGSVILLFCYLPFTA